MAIFKFFLPPGKLIEVIFFLVPTRKILWYLTTNYENFIKIDKTFTIIKFCDAFTSTIIKFCQRLLNKRLIVLTNKITEGASVENMKMLQHPYGGQKWQFLSFFFLWKKIVPTRKVLWYFTNFINKNYIKFLWCFRQIGMWKISQLH